MRTSSVSADTPGLESEAREDSAVAQLENRSSKHEWYAVQTIAGRENSVRDYICTILSKKTSRCGIFFPRRRLKIRRRAEYQIHDYPLFTGYVFLTLPRAELSVLTSAHPQGFIRVVGNGSRPIPVKQNEMDSLFDLTNADDIIEMSEGILAGRDVEITRGPLRGHTGQILSVDKRKCRAKIRLFLNNSPKTVDVGLQIVDVSSN